MTTSETVQVRENDVIHRNGVDWVVSRQGQKTPSVSSVLRFAPKPWLKGWAVKVLANYVANHIDEISEAVKADKAAAVEMMCAIPENVREETAVRGSEAHTAFEAVALGGTPENVSQRVLDAARQFWFFLEEMEAEVIAVEQPVWDESQSYSGRIDLIVRMSSPKAGELANKVTYVDIKTGEIHPDVALQLASYRYAEMGVDADGYKTALPHCEAAAVLQVTDMGWSLTPVVTDEVRVDENTTVKVIDYFKAMREVLDWSQLISKKVVGEPVARGNRSTWKAREKREAA